MNKRITKWAVALAGLLMMVTVAGCAGNKTVATMNGGRISENDYYKEMKDSTSGKQTLQTMIISKALENQYGDKVSKDDVNKKFNSYKKQYGSQFKTLLEQNGLTESKFKDNVRTNLLTEEALKANKKISDKKLNSEWKKYQPKITVSQIVVADENTAKEVITKLDNGEKFSALAKEYSTDTSTKDKGGKLAAFDNTSTQVDSSIVTAAYKLKKVGDYSSTPVTTTTGSYVVLQLNNKPAKGKLADHKSELKERIYTGWMQDSTVMQSVIGKVLKKADVHIKDDDLKNILAGYTGNGSSSNSNSSTSNTTK
nr:peptidylprolyl isomerase [Companilactobacillus metriopterae]